VAGVPRSGPCRRCEQHASPRGAGLAPGEVDEHIGPGVSVHIPAHVDHSIRAVGEGACTILYVYLRGSLSPVLEAG
jgi:hypothetical protein